MRLLRARVAAPRASVGAVAEREMVARVGALDVELGGTFETARISVGGSVDDQ